MKFQTIKDLLKTHWQLLLLIPCLVFFGLEWYAEVDLGNWESTLKPSLYWIGTWAAFLLFACSAIYYIRTPEADTTSKGLFGWLSLFFLAVALTSKVAMWAYWLPLDQQRLARGFPIDKIILGALFSITGILVLEKFQLTKRFKWCTGFVLAFFAVKFFLVMTIYHFSFRPLRYNLIVSGQTQTKTFQNEYKEYFPANAKFIVKTANADVTFSFTPDPEKGEADLGAALDASMYACTSNWSVVSGAFRDEIPLGDRLTYQMFVVIWKGAPRRSRVKDEDTFFQLLRETEPRKAAIALAVDEKRQLIEELKRTNETLFTGVSRFVGNDIGPMRFGLTSVNLFMGTAYFIQLPTYVLTLYLLMLLSREFHPRLSIAEEAGHTRGEIAKLAMSEQQAIVKGCVIPANSSIDSYADNHKWNEQLPKPFFEHKKRIGDFDIFVNVRSIIPKLGFIGTLLGLSFAISSLGSVDETQAILEKPGISQQLASDLGLAFNTTFCALVAPILLQYYIAFRAKKDLNRGEAKSFGHLVGASLGITFSVTAALTILFLLLEFSADADIWSQLSGVRYGVPIGIVVSSLYWFSFYFLRSAKFQDESEYFGLVSSEIGPG